MTMVPTISSFNIGCIYLIQGVVEYVHDVIHVMPKVIQGSDPAIISAHSVFSF